MAIPVRYLKKTNTEPSLKAALLRLMRKKTVAKITIKELCEEAGVYRSTFYCHYSSVEELLVAIQKDIYGELDKALDAYLNGQLNAYEYACSILESVKTAKYDYYSLFCTSSVQCPEFTGEMLKYFTSHIYRIYADIEDEAKRAIIAGFVASGCLACTSTWYKNGCSTPVDEFATILVDLASSIAKN